MGGSRRYASLYHKSVSDTRQHDLTQTLGYSYCQDPSSGVVFLHGSGGELVNMDVCCDGIAGGPADDGRCSNDPSFLGITAFQWLVEGYGTGQEDLDSNAHSYVVFGNTGDTPGWATFAPEDYGIEPLSVMAVVCGDKMV
jgi:hypothetical protein